MQHVVTPAAVSHQFDVFALMGAVLCYVIFRDKLAASPGVVAEFLSLRCVLPLPAGGVRA